MPKVTVNGKPQTAIITTNSNGNIGREIATKHHAVTKLLGLFAQAPAPDDDLQVVLIREPGQPGEIVACRPAFENNITRGDVAVLAAAFGYKASYDPDNANGPRVYLNKEA